MYAEDAAAATDEALAKFAADDAAADAADASAKDSGAADLPGQNRRMLKS